MAKIAGPDLVALKKAEGGAPSLLSDPRDLLLPRAELQ